ncbi:MAG: hypothetical protein KDM91_12170 [Verrucomicrobiae bacterium]|nr:hypothetical protein [Verrucomicrobiae bacterium]
MSQESIQGPLSALRNAGTVCGVCLARETEVLLNLFPFSAARVEEMVTVVDDISLYFAEKGRGVDQMSFGYDGGNLVIVADGDYRLIVMHMLADEIDFIAKAARAFLADFQLGLFAEQMAEGNPRVFAEKASAPAEPAPQAAKPAAAPVKPLVPRPLSPPRPIEAPVAVEIAERDEAVEAVAVEGESSGADEGGQADDDDAFVDGQGARLAANQPESTLPPPRKPKVRFR